MNGAPGFVTELNRGVVTGLNRVGVGPLVVNVVGTGLLVVVGGLLVVVVVLVVDLAVVVSVAVNKTLQIKIILILWEFSRVT